MLNRKISNMNQKQLFEKYAHYIPKGWYGFDGVKDEWCNDIDELLQELIKIPGFEIHQIKEKFDQLRFYTNCKEPDLCQRIKALEQKYS